MLLLAALCTFLCTPVCSAPCRHAPAAHKEASGCSGKRDRTGFVGRASFDERTFFSDYRFLEEVQLAGEHPPAGR